MILNILSNSCYSAKSKKRNKPDFDDFLRKIIIATLITLLFGMLFGCKKLVSIDEPVNTLTTTEAFANDALATSALAGIYGNDMINHSNAFGIGFSNGFTTLLCGMSADEINCFLNFPPFQQFQNNTILTSTNTVYGEFWSDPYSIIYDANASISGLAASPTIHDSVKQELTGEAKFLRAFSYFYLVNFFGDVPLVLTTDYNKTLLLARTSSALIYKQIISDLEDAQSLLANDFSVGGNERIIPNKWAATALLARVYLYTGDYTDAASAASAIISNSSLFGLDPLNSVFLKNSTEAIWQLKQNNANGISLNITPEGSLLIPNTPTSSPTFTVTSELLNAFEANDRRKVSWIDSTVYNGQTYYYPYKYKAGPSQRSANGTMTEYYMVLRLAEQYLIRAEAEAELGDSTDAINDLNTIRSRAILPNYNPTYQGPLLNAIMHEREIEMFAEWGNRWFDLKRSGKAVQVLSSTKGFSISSNALLYPIPIGELTTDPNLVQNPGY